MDFVSWDRRQTLTRSSCKSSESFICNFSTKDRGSRNLFFSSCHIIYTYIICTYFNIFPPSSFRWTKDGEVFDPSSDPELKVTERPGSSAFYTLSNTMDSLKQYQGTYICLASNELGTAVSNEAKLKIDGAYSASRELACSILKVKLGKKKIPSRSAGVRLFLTRNQSDSGV